MVVFVVELYKARDRENIYNFTYPCCRWFFTLLIHLPTATKCGQQMYLSLPLYRPK